MHIIAHAKFPFKVLGALHLRNHILQHRPIGAQEKGDFSCETAGFRILEKGLEFDINSIYRIKGERVWEEISTFFVKGRFGEQGEPSSLAEIETITESEEIGKWNLPANRGKQYAKISGDYNPIHISPTLAKLFGFKRDLVHGFCVFATSLLFCASGLLQLSIGGNYYCHLWRHR
jgi:hypothetical protein